MREIKMKVWVDNERMIGPFDLSQSPTYWAHKLEDGERLLHTGITDKNGVEVYKGDIYHMGDINITYTVIWQDSGFKGKQNGSTSFAGLESWKERIEVIGNIYENPELI